MIFPPLTLGGHGDPLPGSFHATLVSASPQDRNEGNNIGFVVISARQTRRVASSIKNAP
jgi:hypothetical protein